ncbi:MAG TPA: aminotransferase class I/II-fold pyridoxal phosphate-dependent enzyme [Bryobacteraceae bacterium]|jgi:glycine C-acetyltransferase|nr:aminotransferase class I/II-fold pyridoxal phosphate-dependent enzyme [Bryobacteraceae bacterium]
MSDPLAYLGEQLEAWKRAGTYQHLRVLESESAAEARFDGKEVINLASNNYLGLTTHPKLREAALEATRRYGVGSGAVRTISGTMSLHLELEERIARFKNVEACVVFQSGFAASRLSPLRWHPQRRIPSAVQILSSEHLTPVKTSAP